MCVCCHFHFWMCMSLCNRCSIHIREPLQYRKPRLKSDNTKRMIIVEEEEEVVVVVVVVVVVMIVVLCEAFLPTDGTCVALALPSFHWLSFLTFPLSLPERQLQFRVGTRTVAKFCFWFGGFKSLSIGTYWVSAPTLVFGSELCIVSFVSWAPCRF